MRKEMLNKNSTVANVEDRHGYGRMVVNVK